MNLLCLPVSFPVSGILHLKGFINIKPRELLRDILLNTDIVREILRVLWLGLTDGERKATVFRIEAGIFHADQQKSVRLDRGSMPSPCFPDL